MAKQTFTTGSVLTATQMNDLQTNDFNWTVNQKTTSYVLVASDKGTRIEMNSGSATTVTVNTGLFTAGDTLFIQNIGAGVCTITAGTATVQKSSNASLALAQYQGGYLYFISASNAVFFADAGFTSPLTTKGDLFTWDTGNARLAVGSNGQVLQADSTAATGLKWAAAPAGSKTYSLVNSGGTALTGAATITVSGITGDDLLILVIGASSASAFSSIAVRFNADTGSKYSLAGPLISAPSTYSATYLGRNSSAPDSLTAAYLGVLSSNAASSLGGYLRIFGCKSTGLKPYICAGSAGDSGGNGHQSYISGGTYSATAAITSISLFSDTGNFDAGTVYVYEAQ